MPKFLHSSGGNAEHLIFSSYLRRFSSRGKLLVTMNCIFFTSVFAVAIVSELLLPPRLYSEWQPQFPDIFLGDNLPFLFSGIFLSNLILSAFVIVTFPGFVFFPISSAMLVFRGFLWGVLLAFQPTWLLLSVIPIIVLEGEGYVFAALAGTVVGVSWLKPRWLYREVNITRAEAFHKALKECLDIYLFVVLFLLVAAVVEAVTLGFLF
jgi:hypothetical protein